MFSRQNNNELDDTLLRSIILFNQTSGAPKADDLMHKAIFAIIVKGNGHYDLRQINDILNERFSLEYDDKATSAKISQLIKDKYVSKNADGTYVASRDTEEGSAFYSSLESRTKNLINGVVQRVRNYSGLVITNDDERTLYENTQKALSAYYHLYGYSFFELKNKSEENITDAVSIARQGLSTKLGEALVRALFDVINNPDKNERETLEAWARAFVALEILNLDPALRNFKITRIKNKSFVIDTDVVLHCLAGHSKFSKEYLQIAAYIKHAGCKIIFPRNVIEEVDRHLRIAPTTARTFGASLENATDELLENNNVFVEGYVKLKRDKKHDDLDLETYLGNLFDHRDPSLLETRLDAIFGSGRVVWEDSDLEEINDRNKQEFADGIKKLTQQSQKGITRLDYQNQDIADADARLYLTILKKNSEELDSTKVFSHKYYLMTQTKKIRNVANKVFKDRRQSSFVCSPAAILAILNEAGVCKNDDVKYINLFENPFLSLTAEKIWDQVKPLLEKGAKIKHKDFHRLRCDVDIHFDQLLVGGDAASESAREIKERGYDFVDEVIEASDTIKAKDDLIRQQKETIRQMQEDMAKMQERAEKNLQQRKKSRYEDRLLKKKSKKRK